MTKQEMFEKALNGLRAQGKPSVNYTGHCVYRATDGSKCAVGMLISDEDYSSEMEGHAADHSTVLTALGAYNVNFLVNMQRQLHDDIRYAREFPVALERNAKLFAKDWELDLPRPM